MRFFARIFAFLVACWPRRRTKVKVVAVVSRNIAFEEFMDPPIKTLKQISVDLTPKQEFPGTEKKRRIITKSMIVWMHMLNSIIYAASIIYDTHQNQWEDLRKTYCVTVCICLSLILSKVVLFTVKKNAFVDFITQLQDYYPKLKSCNEETKKFLQHHKLLVNILRGLFLFCLSTLASTPLIVYRIQGQLVMPIPFARSIFDPTKNIAIYLLVYIWEMVVYMQCIFVYLGSDLLIFTMIMIVALEWTILARDFCNLKHYEHLSDVKKRLVELIERHIKLIQLSNTLKKMLRNYYAFYITINAMGLGTSTFRIRSDFGWNQMTMINVTIVVVLLTELFWNCFFGQLLISSSEELEKAVYDCGWENWFDASTWKTVRIVLMMAQKNAKLTTGFKDVSMPHFHDAVDKAYNYHSFLGDIYGKKLK